MIAENQEIFSLFFSFFLFFLHFLVKIETNATLLLLAVHGDLILNGGCAPTSWRDWRGWR